MSIDERRARARAYAAEGMSARDIAALMGCALHQVYNDVRDRRRGPVELADVDQDWTADYLELLVMQRALGGCPFCWSESARHDRSCPARRAA